MDIKNDFKSSQIDLFKLLKLLLCVFVALSPGIIIGIYGIWGAVVDFLPFSFFLALAVSIYEEKFLTRILLAFIVLLLMVPFDYTFDIIKVFAFSLVIGLICTKWKLPIKSKILAYFIFHIFRIPVSFGLVSFALLLPIRSSTSCPAGRGYIFGVYELVFAVAYTLIIGLFVYDYIFLRLSDKLDGNKKAPI